MRHSLGALTTFAPKLPPLRRRSKIMDMKPVEPDRLADTPRPPPDFDGIGIAKELLRTIRSGALATLDRESGAPFASLVTVATDVDGSPLLLMSRLSGHTLNLEADPRASILLAKAAEATRPPIRA